MRAYFYNYGMTIRSKDEYQRYLESLGGLPTGFQSAVTSLNFTPRERSEAIAYSMNMALILLSEPSESFAAVFTQNAVCGVPVIIGRKRLERKSMQAVLLNNRIANVAGEGGMDTVKALCARVGELFNIDGDGIFPSSTGIIGWRLPREEMLNALPGLTVGNHLIELARAIMTTDRYPKIRVKQLGRGRIVGIAKGAGMIEPNMATMLSIIMTDFDIGRDDLRRMLKSAVDDSFNTISIDGDQSTSDMVLAFSSRKYGIELASFEEALRELCQELSQDVVRNGEGTAHVMAIEVGGNRDQGFCRRIGKAVGNSLLVKTAVYGNDPNVGRILSAVGDQAGAEGVALDLQRLSLHLGREIIFQHGVFTLNKEKENSLRKYLEEQAQDPVISGYPQHDRCVHIRLDFGGEGQFQRVLASDLGHEYVHENADYRS